MTPTAVYQPVTGAQVSQSFTTINYTYSHVQEQFEPATDVQPPHDVITFS